MRNLNLTTSLILTLLLLVGAAGSLYAATIGGTIYDEMNEPKPNAMVQLMKLWPNAQNQEMLFRTTISTANGTYLFVDIPDGDYHVSAIAPEYVRSFYVSPDGNILVVEIDADDQEVVGIDIQLQPQNNPPPPQCTGVSGRVLNLDDVPLPHIPVGIVEISDLNTPLPNFVTMTNFNGFYQLRNLLPGTYKTCVLGLDLLPAAYSNEFTVVQNTMVDNINIIFDAPAPPPAGAISGHVIGLPPNNNMMMQVGLVTLDDLTTPLPGLTGHVGWSGFYVIRNIPVGTYKACVLDQDGLPVAYSEPVTVVAYEMVQNVDIVLGTYVAFSISGSVFNAQNEPVTQGVVELRSTPNQTPPYMHHMHRVTQIDSTGSYMFTNIPAGQYIVAVWTLMSPVVFYPSTFDITEAVPVVVVDEDLTGINVTIPVVQTYTISGYVKDADTEAPLEGIKVRTDRMGFHHFPMQHPMFNNEFNAVTDATGFYSITAPFGRYTLAAVDTTHYYRIQFYDHAFLPFQATVIVLDQDYTNVNFDLYPRLDSLQCSIGGTITENGEPVTYPVMVVAVSSDEDWEDSTISNADGSYLLNHVRPGQYYVVAYSLYSPPLYYDNVLSWEDADLVTVYGPVSGINFNLVNTDADGPSNLSGVITDGSNNALGNVMVVLTDAQQQIIGFARSDDEGNYFISNVPSDSYTVHATKMGYASVTQNVYLDGNDYLNLSLAAPTSNDDTVVPAILSGVTNYPNPFNPNTTIALALAKDAEVSVRIFNVKGQVIRTLLNGNVKAGIHNLLWNGADDDGNTVSSGIYLVKVQGAGFSKSHKMTLMK